MKQILITGGTTFVSKYTAMYFVQAGYDVFVLNRNTKPQVAGVHLIDGDRHQLGKLLQGYAFDAIVDVTAYNDTDVDDLLDTLDTFGQYILISSSAVYPETGLQPFDEKQPRGYNKYWGAYGLGKVAAEDAAIQRTKDAYILRPPYLYGPMNNVYREAFVFDCARDNRAFYLPRDGKMKLQFFHVRDLCRCVEAIICNAPSEHIYNVGNQDVISVKDWVTLCYAALD